MTRAEEEGCGGRCCLAILFYKHSPNQRKEKKEEKSDSEGSGALGVPRNDEKDNVEKKRNKRGR